MAFLVGQDKNLQGNNQGVIGDTRYWIQDFTNNAGSTGGLIKTPFSNILFVDVQINGGAVQSYPAVVVAGNTIAITTAANAVGRVRVQGT